MLRRFFIKTSSARFLAPPYPNRTRCAGLRFGGLRRVLKKLVVRSFCCSSLSPCKRFAGLHGDGGGVAVFLIGVPAKARRSGLCGERTSSKVSESRRIRRDEGYEACEDERRRLLAVCRGHAATAGLFRRKANPPSSTSSSQASYRLRRVFFKTRRALILLLLAFTAQTLRWFARRWRRGCRFFIKTSSARFLAPPGPNRIRCAGLRFGGLRRVFLKLVVRSFCCSSLSPRKRFAGLHGDGGGVAVFL